MGRFRLNKAGLPERGSPGTGKRALAALAGAFLAVLVMGCPSMADSGATEERDWFQVMKERHTRMLIGTADDPAYTNTRNNYAETAQKYLRAINPDFTYTPEANPTLNWLWTKEYGRQGDSAYVPGCNFETLPQLEPLTAQYQRLETLAAAYAIEGQPLYHRDEIYNIIVNGLPVIMKQGLFDVYTDWETDKKDIYPGLGNKAGWFEWHITMPRSIGNILILMLDRLPPGIIAEWAGYAHRYAGAYRTGPNYSVPPYANPSIPPAYLDWGLDGANNADLQMAAITLAIAAAYGPGGADGKEGARTASGWLLDAKNKLEMDTVLYPAVLKNSWDPSGDAGNGKNNGPYEDGSYIYHGDIAYIGSYGGEAVSNMAKVADGVISDTPYKIDQTKFSGFLDWAPQGIIPMLWGGKMMSIVNGRSAVRNSSHGKGMEYNNGRVIMAELAKMVSAVGTAEQQRKIIGPLKYNVQTGYGYFDNYASTTSEERRRILTGLLNGSYGGGDIPAQKYTGMISYGAEDKVVQHIGGYAVALGLSSTRIAAYEWTNAENLKGWFQGDGTVWLYNDDWGQFAQNYLATVDPMHLPGVTSSMAAPPSPPAANGTFVIRGGSGHAGGVTDGTTGAAAMIVSKSALTSIPSAPLSYASRLEARKSWFLLDGAIVSLGAGIKDTGGADEIHTTVENRELTEGISQQTILNGISAASTRKGAYAHLAGISGQPGTAIGYVFLADAGKVAADKETNDRPIKEIYTSANENIRYQASYFKMYISHGSNPVDAKYAYVTLPGKSAAETAAYAANVDSHLTILSNTADIQALEAGNIVALSVFSANGGSVTAAEGLYQVDKQALVQVKKLENNRYSIAVSYPLHAEGTVTLTLPFTVTADRMDAGVRVSGNTVTVRSNNIGSSYTAEVTRSN